MLKKLLSVFVLLTVLAAAAPSNAFVQKGIMFAGGLPPSPPVNSVAPVTNGDVYEGSTLSCASGSWSGFPSPTYTYKWQQSTVDIGGATSQTYVVDATRATGDVRCVVTAVNVYGSASANGNSLAAFDPTTVATTFAWFDASDVATITDAGGGSVSQWNDKSGNAYNLTGPASHRPVTGTRTLNSKNIIDFNGSSQVMTGAAGILGTTSPAMTIFTVYLPDNTTTNLYVMTTNNDDLQSTRINNQGQAVGASGVSRASPTSASGIIHVMRRQAAPGIKTNRMKINSDSEVTSTAGDSTTTASTETWVGSYLIGGTGGIYYRPFDGGIAEIIVYSGELSNANANRVQAWLSAKWNVAVTALP